MEAMSRNRTSVVYISGDKSNGGEVSRIESLLGQCVRKVCGIGDKVYAVTPSLLVDIEEDTQTPIDGIVELSSGAKHVVGLSNSGELYSWGVGESGELGHGGRFRSIQEPKKIDHKAFFVGISCGSNHSCAVDDKGNVYAWGQNFDHQLGLYRKSEGKLPSGAHVEQVMMTPKFIPLSLINPIKTVSCGSRFTVAISQAGELWSWGAGESGQLGTGRCTYRDVPDVCISQSTFGESFVGAACGFGHIIACSKSGKLYSWGLNVKGQLGLGDIEARQHPKLVEGISDITNVFADGHSSACLNSNGELYTWGSGLHYRLMNGNCTDIVYTPSLVENMSGNVVADFVFTSSKGLALVNTKALKLNPESGPQKTFSHLEIHGCGFWESETIVVKFIPQNDDETAIPRSCLGKYVRENVIACKPPKMGELGKYGVTVSMNGVDFLEEVLSLDICPDPICNSLLWPEIFNARKHTEHVSDIVVEASQLSKKCETEGIFIQLRDTVDDTKEALIVKGYFESDEEKEERMSSTNYISSPNDDPESGIRRVVVKDVDLSKLFAVKDHSYCSISAQVSSSNQDFSAPSPEQCIAHYFNVYDIEPQCCPTSGQREILVHGTSIPPSSLKIEAILGLSHMAKNGTSVLLELNLPTRTNDDEKICFTIPPADDIFVKNGESVPANVDHFSVEISFRLPNGRPLQDSAFQFNYYREQPINIFPRAVRATGGTKLTITSNYIRFVSDEAHVSFIEKTNNLEKNVKFSAFKEIEGEDFLTYAIECDSPILLPAEEDDDEEVDERHFGDKVYIGLLLDGISRPIDSFLFEAELFEEVILESPISKSPVSVGSTVTAMASGLVDSDVCIIRIRSAKTDEYIELDGEIGEELDCLSFSIPEEARELFPEDGSKTGSYFLDISIDGSTFDVTDSPSLLLKHI